MINLSDTLNNRSGCLFSENNDIKNNSIIDSIIFNQVDWSTPETKKEFSQKVVEIKASKIKSLHLLKWSIKNKSTDLSRALIKNGSLDAISSSEKNDLFFTLLKNEDFSNVDLLMKLNIVSINDNEKYGWLSVLINLDVDKEISISCYRHLLTQIPDLLDYSDYRGYTPLFHAIKANHRTLVTALIELKANIHHKDNNGYTPLLIAALEGNIDLIDLLLINGADIHDVTNKKFDVLTTIARSRNFSSKKKLVWIENFINKFDFFKQNCIPLLFALMAQNKSLYDALINLGFDFSLDFVVDLLGEPGVELHQNKIISQINKYLVLDNSNDLTFFSLNIEEGMCAGFAFLFCYYLTQNKKAEFYDSLKEIALWDGTKDSLGDPLPPSLSRVYVDKAHLFKHWINDLVFFQGSLVYSLEELNNNALNRLLKEGVFNLFAFNRQDSYLEKYAAVRKESSPNLHLISRIYCSSAGKLKNLIDLHREEKRFFLIGFKTEKSSHAVSLELSPESIYFYDSNLRFESSPHKDSYLTSELVMFFLNKTYKIDRFNESITVDVYELNDKKKSFLQLFMEDKENKISPELIVHFHKENPLSIDEQNTEGLTPLMLAVAKERGDLVEILISLGVDINKTTKSGLSPFSLSCDLLNFNMMQRLLDAGADMQTDHRGESTIEYLFKWIKLYPKKSKDFANFIRKNPTLLFDYSYPEILIKWFLDEDNESIASFITKQTNLVNKAYENDIKILEYYCGVKDVGFVSLLLKNGADPNNGMDHAIRHNNIDIYELLIQYGADIKNNRYFTKGLHLLAKNNFPSNDTEKEWLRLLIKKHPNYLNEIDKDGFTPLQIALFWRNKTFLNCFPEESAELDLNGFVGDLIYKTKGWGLSCSLNEQWFYFLSEVNFNDKYFKNKEIEQGLSFLFGYYASRGKLNEFYASLREILSWQTWEENQLSEPPSDENLASIYETRAKVMEHWLNDVLYFGNSLIYPNFSKSLWMSFNKWIEKDQSENNSLLFGDKLAIIQKDVQKSPIRIAPFKIKLQRDIKMMLSVQQNIPRMFHLTLEKQNEKCFFTVYVSKNNQVKFFDPRAEFEFVESNSLEQVSEDIIKYLKIFYELDLDKSSFYGTVYNFKD